MVKCSVLGTDSIFEYYLKQLHLQRAKIKKWSFENSSKHFTQYISVPFSFGCID
jgi:hypothetical protein